MVPFAVHLITCSSCGAEVEPDDDHCTRCGSRLRRTA